MKHLPITLAIFCSIAGYLMFPYLVELICNPREVAFSIRATGSNGLLTNKYLYYLTDGSVVWSTSKESNGADICLGRR